MSHVEMWALLGIGRISALAKQLGVSRQYVSKKIGSLNTNEVLIAINNIEQYEMRSERCIKNNIMSAAKHVKSKDDALRDRAYFSLASWSEIYSDFVNK